MHDSYDVLKDTLLLRIQIHFIPSSIDILGHCWIGWYTKFPLCDATQFWNNGSNMTQIHVYCLSSRHHTGCYTAPFFACRKSPPMVNMKIFDIKYLNSQMFMKTYAWKIRFACSYIFNPLMVVFLEKNAVRQTTVYLKYWFWSVTCIFSSIGITGRGIITLDTIKKLAIESYI